MWKVLMKRGVNENLNINLLAYIPRQLISLKRETKNQARLHVMFFNIMLDEAVQKCK